MRRFQLPMRLIDRYLLRELLVPLGYCVGGFLIFWITFDLFGQLEGFQRDEVGALGILRYYWAKLPELMATVLPVALLLATLYAMTTLARHNEFVAIRAAGVSFGRIFAPYWLLGIGLSLALFYVNEEWAGASRERAEAIRAEFKKGNRPASRRHWHEPLLFKNHRENRIWNIEAYNDATSEMINPHIDWTLPKGPEVQLIAERGIWTNHVWTFFNVKQFTFPASGIGDPVKKTFPVLVVDHFTETPEELRSEIKISQLTNVKLAKQAQISLREIRDYTRMHPDMPPEQQARLATQYHGRLAWPWTCLVVILLATPFGAPSAKRNVFVGVASSVFICFFYFVLLRFGLALGTRGVCPPWLAAWMPNALFGGFGAWMSLRVR